MCKAAEQIIILMKPRRHGQNSLDRHPNRAIKAFGWLSVNFGRLKQPSSTVQLGVQQTIDVKNTQFKIKNMRKHVHDNWKSGALYSC